MRISVLEDSPDRLCVRMTPTSAIAATVFSVLMLGGGAFLAWVLSDCSEISIKDGQVHYHTGSFHRFGVREGSLPVADVTFDTQVYESSISKTQDVTLRSRSGDVRLPFPFLDGDGKQKIVENLELAAAEGRDHQETSGDGGPVAGVALGIIVGACGVFCLFFLQSSRLVCSRADDTMTVTISRWLLPGTKRNSVRLSEFQNIATKEVSVGSHNTPTASSNYVLVQTSSGQSLSLSSGPMFTDESTVLITETIESWVEREPVAV